MNGAPAPGRRAAAIAGAAVALLVALAWPLLHPAQPPLPTDDLYAHLSVARHLAQGEGFRCDIAYPLSFAWPFARELPQPLVHRPPAWPVALVLPYAIAGPDPVAVVAAVRLAQVALLAGLVGLGAWAWLRRGRAGAAAAWVLIACSSPLLPYAVDWGQTELPAAAILLACWLRHREGRRAPGPRDGAAVAALALLRPELAWLPPAWWAWLRRPGEGGRPVASRRGLLTALAVATVLVAPWAIRNARVTGDPFFSVQAHAELAKDTRAWPGYDVYRQLEPQPPARALRAYPEAVARKAARGLRFYRDELPALLPWAAPLLLLAGALAGLRRARGPGGLRAPAATAVLTVLALAALYSPFDHSLRHLVAVVPLLAWEAAPWLGEWPWSLLPGRAARLRGSAPGAVAAAMVLAVPLLALTAREPAGWPGAAREAALLQAEQPAEAARLRALPAGAPAFTGSAAAAWLSGRPAVWSPLDESVAARIAAWLEPGTPTDGGRQP